MGDDRKVLIIPKFVRLFHWRTYTTLVNTVRTLPDPLADIPTPSCCEYWLLMISECPILWKTDPNI